MNILISACLTGCNCKYNGKNNFNKKVSALLDKHTVICVCPEQAGGLPTPRMPSEIKDGRVITENGTDVTESFLNGAKASLSKALKYNCTAAVLKANSPSCGFGKIYDGSFSHKLTDGNGIFAQMLFDNGIKIFTENDELNF